MLNDMLTLFSYFVMNAVRKNIVFVVRTFTSKYDLVIVNKRRQKNIWNV